MNVILHRNAAPIYKFLSIILNQNPSLKPTDNKKILECGAGGRVPPLALFSQHGFKTTGIDISRSQLQLAQEYVNKNNLDVDFHYADMKNLPFEDQSFDYVYEHYSLCHLNPEDTQKALDEMYRVLKKGGLCFIGVISENTWPKMLIGEKSGTYEYSVDEGSLCHYVYDDNRANKLVEKFSIIEKEKVVKYLLKPADEFSPEEWDSIYDSEIHDTPDEWNKLYPHRHDYFKYVHLYYYLKKM